MVACSRGPAYSSLTVRRYSHTHSAKARDSLELRSDPHDCVELAQDPRRGVGGCAGRGNAVEQAVEFVMFQDGGDVEPLDERAAVIASRHNAVVFELNQRLLDGNPADPQAVRDFIAVDAVPAAQFAGQ